MTTQAGRPPLPPGEAYSVTMTVKLTPHQKKVLDGLVTHIRTIPGHGNDTAPGVVRDLIRQRYRSALTHEKMPPVERDD